MVTAVGGRLSDEFSGQLVVELGCEHIVNIFEIWGRLNEKSSGCRTKTDRRIAYDKKCEKSLNNSLESPVLRPKRELFRADFESHGEL